MNYFCFANNKILHKNDVKVGVNDLVMLRGYGVFDYLRTYNGAPFRINYYLDRFEKSVNGMSLKLLLSKKQITFIVHRLLKMNKASSKKEFGIRLLLTGGYSLDSFLPSVKPNLFILIEDLPQYPAWWSEKGVKLILHEHAREMAGVKTINYLTAIRLAEERRKNKAQDTLYYSKETILETTRNNFFLFHKNTLVTTDKHILLGVTRRIILEIAKDKFKIEVRSIKLKELTTSTECFITGTTRGITPVVKVGAIKIGNGKPGKNTQLLMKLFDEQIQSNCSV